MAPKQQPTIKKAESKRGSPGPFKSIDRKQDDNSEDEYYGDQNHLPNGTKLVNDFGNDSVNGKEEKYDNANDIYNDDSSGNNDLDNEDDIHSMESATAQAAGTSPDNTPPQSPKHSLMGTPSIAESNTVVYKRKSKKNENFVGVITEVFELPFYERGHQNVFKPSKKVHWKGVDWNILIGVHCTSQQIGAFFGADSWENLPNDWVASIHYKFELLDDNNKVVGKQIILTLSVLSYCLSYL